MTKNNPGVVDKITMAIGGALLLIAIPIMGIINVVAGSETPLYVYELTQGGETTTGQVIATELAPEGASIIHSPPFDPNMRAILVALALTVFGLFAVYRLVGFAPSEREERRRVVVPE